MNQPHFIVHEDGRIEQLTDLDYLRMWPYNAGHVMRLVETMKPEPGPEHSVPRQMNTHMRYPTSNPPWARRNK